MNNDYLEETLIHVWNMNNIKYISSLASKTSIHIIDSLCSLIMGI